MKSVRHAFAVVAVCASAVAAEAHAQPLPYASDDERFGASLVAPLGRRELVKRTMEYCSGELPEMKLDMQIAYAQWVRRHAAFLRMATSMRAGLAKSAAQDNEKAALLKRMLDDYFPKQIDRIAGTMVQAIADMPVAESRKQLCREAVSSVNGGRFDLDSADPEIARYMRRLAEKFHIGLPPAGVAAPAFPGNRDELALVGSWKAEKVVYHMPDGSERELPGTCRTQFLSGRILVQCAAGGREARIVSTYHHTGPGRYESEIVEHSVLPALVGTRGGATFRVDGGELYLSVYPLSSKNDENRPVEVESVSVPEPRSTQ